MAENPQEDEIKEFHFHTYFFQHVETSKQEAAKLRARIDDLITCGYFPPKCVGRSSDGPIGPHPVGMFEIWCPKEYFGQMFSWFVLNRGNLSVLIHPLTIEEMMDHSTRAVWMGPSFPLDLTVHVRDRLPQVALEHPELGLGYSAAKK